MRRLALLGGVVVLVLSFASQARAEKTTPVSMTFTEPIVPGFKSGNCPVLFPAGLCGSGEVTPYGHATETIVFGAGCGGACDLRTVSLAQGSIIMDETFGDGQCPGSCRPNPAEPGSGTLTDVITGGSGIFRGVTGELIGTVTYAGPANQVKLSGSITLAS
jgi:hypothetical protein